MFFPAAPRLTLDQGYNWKVLWPGNAVVFARARFALASGVTALARRHDLKRVWIPAYLCAPVPDAVRAAGLVPTLYDIDARLEPRYDTIEPRRGDALLIVHYFGLLPSLQRVSAFATNNALPVIEDCAHALPSPDRLGAGSVGDVSAWSLRKLGPMPGGGLLTATDARVRLAIQAPRPCTVPDARTLARLAIMTVEGLAESIGYNPLAAKGRLPVLDTSPDHKAATPTARAHHDEFASPPRPARLIRALWLRADWSRIVTKRRAAYRALVAELPRAIMAVPDPTRGSVPESFPLVVSDPARVVRALRSRGVEASRWPGPEQFAFDRKRFPGAARWVEQSLCVPVGTGLTLIRMQQLSRIVRETLEDTGAVATAAAARAA
jgi:dTDP-4-amino-4,6-dideoxygalactose transaminase